MAAATSAPPLSFAPWLCVSELLLQREPRNRLGLVGFIGFTGFTGFIGSVWVYELGL